MESTVTDEPRAARSASRDLRSEEAVLGRLMADHGDAVYRLARSVVQDPALADDVVQETMVKAWRALDGFEDGEVPRAWLLKVARNTSISLLRARRDEVRDAVTFSEIAAVGEGPATTAVDRAALERLWGALRGLDETSRSLVVLRELSGLSYEEIAEILTLPVSTVKTKLFRARRRLASSMQEWRS